MKRTGSLGLGLALCVGALMVALAPNTSTLMGWIARLWPVLPIVAGLGSLIGFASKRRPRSPFTGGLLLAFGGLALAFTLQASSNPFEFFGRFWPLLIGVIGFSEILKHYTHRPEMGDRPALFSVGKLSLVGIIVVTGLVSSRVAAADPNLLANLMPAGLDKLRDSLFGEEFTFEALTETADFAGTEQLVIENRFGLVQVEGGDVSTIQASVLPRVRAYDQPAASRVAEQLRLVLDRSGATLTVRTNRDEIDHEMTTDLKIVVPKTANVRISQAHGAIVVRNLTPAAGKLEIASSHAPIEVRDVTAGVTIDNSHEKVLLDHVEGNVRITGRNDIDMKSITGDVYIKDADDVAMASVVAGRIELESVDHANIAISKVTHKDPSGKVTVIVDGSHSDVTLREIFGDVRVQANHGEVAAADVTGTLDVDARHTQVEATRMGALKVVTSHEKVTAREIAGAVNIQNDHGDVIVSEFAAEISIRTSFDDVRLENSREPSGGVYVENEHGKIYLGLPLGPQYAIDSQVKRGDVKIDSQFSLSSASTEAKNRIVLKTSNDDIIVRPVGVRPAD